VLSQTRSSFMTARLVPEAAKAASPASASGRESGGKRAQVAPPSVVEMIKNCPSIGSPTASPFFSSKKASPSRNTPGESSAKVCVQVSPPSVVRKILAGRSMPMMTVSSRLNASMSRKSVVSAPGTGRMAHVDPPSSVLKTVPFDPLAQAVRSSTTETPRRLAFVPLAWTIQE